MKKLTIAILILLLASPCLAEEPITLARMSTAIVGGGTSIVACNDSLGHDTQEASTLGTGDFPITALDVAACTGKAKLVKVYSSCASSINVKVGLYKGATYSTATLVGMKAFTGVGTWSAEWHDFDVSDQNWDITSGDSYWIAFQVSAAFMTFYEKAEAGGSYYYTAAVHPFANAWPDPFGAATVYNYLFSIYVTVQ
jgi:hypothetical protein